MRMKNLLRKGIRNLKYQFARGALILIYHRISESALDPWSLSVSPNHFAEHLAVLQRSFHPTSLQDLAQSLRDGSKLRSGSIVITFDDGYADNLHIAQPLLERFDCPATVFLVTGAIGAQYEFWWDELATLLLQPHPLPERLELSIHGEAYSWQLGKAEEYGQADYSRYRNWRAGQPSPSFRHDLYRQLWQLIQPLSTEAQNGVMDALRAWAGDSRIPPAHRLLNREECIELSQAKQIEIGAHTINHVSLASLSGDSQCSEIFGSKTQLEKILNEQVKSFSYPFGKREDYNPETVAVVQEAGFSVACCNESGVVHRATDLFQLPRIHIPDCSAAEFENRLLSKFYA